jgi:hypothetical protein
MPVRPPAREDATLLQHGLVPPGAAPPAGTADWAPEVPDLPVQYEDDLPPHMPGNTGANVALRALAEGELPENTGERARRTQNNLERRRPVDSRARPSLLPAGMEPTMAPARQANPGVLQPMRSTQDVAVHREGSDVIQVFSAGGAPPQARPAPAPARPNHLVRKGPPAQPAPPPASANPAPQPTVRPMAPQPLPLALDRVSALTQEHRTRLRALDGYARVLEIGAGVLGTIALALLVASLISILLGNGQSLVVGGTAVLAGVTGVGAAVLMVAGAAGLRQVAHLSSQLTALIESLGPPR